MNNDTWSIFSSEQEYLNPIRDQYGRSTQFLVSHPLREATVSRYLYEKGFRPEYPEGKDWAVLLSHDVDWLNQLSLTPRQWVFNQAKSLLKGQFSGFVKGWSMRKTRRLRAYDLERLLQAHEQRNIRSTYFFLALEEGEEDFNYRLRSVRDQLAKVTEQGSEIGLHGGHRAFNSSQKLAEEIGRLREFVPDFVGYRNHYLRFDIPHTWQILRENRLAYDATFGFAGMPGFRNGMCHPFRPFDRQAGRYIDMLEFPLHLMDVSLFHYLGLKPDAAFELVKLLLEEVRELRGVFSMLWHNNYLDGEWGQFYLKVVDYLSEMNPYFATHKEMYDWWQEKSYSHQTEHLLEQIQSPEEAPGSHIK